MVQRNRTYLNSLDGLYVAKVRQSPLCLNQPWARPILFTSRW